jgi:multiple sugar transport system ATP-binding protein
MSEIELRGVRKEFGGQVVAVNDVSLTIQNDELVVFVGPSGSGKSTTLRMIAGLESPSAGQIIIDGRDVTDVEPQDRDIAMVFQSFALYPHRTVWGNLAFPLQAQDLGPDQIEERVKEAARILGIGELLDRRPSQLSGGQRQRVALGRAIVRDPQAFLMDEPLANLDAKLRTKMRAEVVGIQQDLEVTMIHVTHNQEEAMTMGDRVVVMNEGEIQQVDTPERVYNEPSNKFVAGFMGSPSMNLIEGVAKEGQFNSTDGGISLGLLDSYREVTGDVTLGIRPESFRVGELDSDVTIDVTANIVELLGNVKICHFDAGGSTILAELQTDVEINRGESYKLSCSYDCLHMFDGTDPSSERINLSER